MTKVSVIMSVYKEKDEWLRLSIESILNQTFHDFEFLIVNDCPGREDNKRILNEYVLKDSRVHIIENNENIGLTKSLNRALEKAQGEYIARMDADDWSSPMRLEKQVRYLDAHLDCVMVGCFAIITNELGRIIDKAQTSDDYKYLQTMIPCLQPVYHPSMMYRRIIDGIPVLYNEKMSASQDYELCSRLISYPMSNIPEFLLYYRCSKNQMTRVYKDKYIILDAPIRTQMLRKYYDGVTAQDANAFIDMYYKQRTTKERIGKVDSFIKHIYNNNLSNERIYLNTIMTFILIRYYQFLSNNGSKMHAFVKFVKNNYALGNRYYFSMLSYIVKKMSTRIRYKLFKEYVIYR